MVTTQFMVTALILSLLSVAIIVGYLWWMNRLFNVRATLRWVLSGGAKQIEQAKGRIFQDKNGVTMIKIVRKGNRKKLILPVPPDKVFNTDKKGKKCIDIYVSHQEGHRYIKDEFQKAYFHQDKYTPDEDFVPVLTFEKQFYVEQMREAEKWKSKSIGDKLTAAIPWFMLIIIFFGMFLFWEDITKPSLQAMDKMGKIAEEQRETQVLLNEIINREQILKDYTPPEKRGGG